MYSGEDAHPTTRPERVPAAAEETQARAWGAVQQGAGHSSFWTHAPPHPPICTPGGAQGLQEGVPSISAELGARFLPRSPLSARSPAPGTRACVLLVRVPRAQMPTAQPTCAWATQKPAGPQAEEQGWGWGQGRGRGCSDQQEMALPPPGLSDRTVKAGVSLPTRDETRDVDLNEHSEAEPGFLA